MNGGVGTLLTAETPWLAVEWMTPAGYLARFGRRGSVAPGKRPRRDTDLEQLLYLGCWFTADGIAYTHVTSRMRPIPNRNAADLSSSPLMGEAGWG
jgi:hypothetical protein